MVKMLDYVEVPTQLVHEIIRHLDHQIGTIDQYSGDAGEILSDAMRYIESLEECLNEEDETVDAYDLMNDQERTAHMKALLNGEISGKYGEV